MIPSQEQIDETLSLNCSPAVIPIARGAISRLLADTPFDMVPSLTVLADRCQRFFDDHRNALRGLDAINAKREVMARHLAAYDRCGGNTPAAADMRARALAEGLGARKASAGPRM